MSQILNDLLGVLCFTSSRFTSVKKNLQFIHKPDVGGRIRISNPKRATELLNCILAIAVPPSKPIKTKLYWQAVAV